MMISPLIGILIHCFQHKKNWHIQIHHTRLIKWSNIEIKISSQYKKTVYTNITIPLLTFYANRHVRFSPFIMIIEMKDQKTANHLNSLSLIFLSEWYQEDKSKEVLLLSRIAFNFHHLAMTIPDFKIKIKQLKETYMNRQTIQWHNPLHHDISRLQYKWWMLRQEERG
jgi:hypothetical protein